MTTIERATHRLRRALPDLGEMPRSALYAYVNQPWSATAERIDAVRDRLVATGRIKVRRSRNKMGGRVELWRWVR